MTHRILVCDDEASLRRMLSDHLTECGFEVVQAEDASELKTALSSEDPDLVLLDVRMPGKDGLTALRELRETSTVPVLMLTAAGDIVDKVLGLEFGADDYLVKPVDLRELQARIKAALRRSDLGREDVSETGTRLTGVVPFGPCKLDLDGARLLGLTSFQGGVS